MRSRLPAGLKITDMGGNRYQLTARFATTRSYRNARLFAGLICIPGFLICAAVVLSNFDRYPMGIFAVPAFVMLTTLVGRIFELTVKQKTKLTFDARGVHLRGQTFSVNEAWRPRVVPHWQEDQKTRDGKSKLRFPAVEVIIDSGPGFARRTSVTEIIAPNAVELSQRLIGAMADLYQRASQPVQSRPEIAQVPSRPTAIARQTFVQQVAPGIRLYSVADGFNLKAKLPTIRTKGWVVGQFEI